MKPRGKILQMIESILEEKELNISIEGGETTFEFLEFDVFNFVSLSADIDYKFNIHTDVFAVSACNKIQDVFDIVEHELKQKAIRREF